MNNPKKSRLFGVPINLAVAICLSGSLTYIHFVEKSRNRRQATLESLPAGFGTESTFTEGGIDRLFSENCGGEKLIDLVTWGIEKNGLGKDVSIDYALGAYSSKCGPKLDQLVEDINTKVPKLSALYTPEERWDAETKEAVGLYRKLEGMLVYHDSHEDALHYGAILSALAGGVSESAEKLPGYWNVEYCKEVVELLKKQGGIENDTIYFSTLRSIVTSQEKLKRAIPDMWQRDRVEKAREYIETLGYLHVDVQNLRRNSGGAVIEVSLNK
ncbi:hypothetical protein HY638_00620 [Candidatus Woesearchaeota archaeon]|nr:hypothetical protein [Candidatus Woesearchaeota archaeon]